ncbi:Hypothetical predicted protein [Paramuricea clavata]|uniref:Uncharacterized protein n=1 Tax=Paramuricea clavata TaxID=317549 RepID=A0A7D9DWU0_PARCT|nr:Hypothetical predicted protein [Paramuricea clavata]
MSVQCLGVQRCVEDAIHIDQVVNRIYAEQVKNILNYIGGSIHTRKHVKEMKIVEEIGTELKRLFCVIIAPNFIQGYRSIYREMYKNMAYLDQCKNVCRFFNSHFCECSSFQVYIPFVPFNETDYTIRYQIRKVHGLPIVNTRLTDDFFTLKESMDFLTKEFLNNADLVAYKGGDIERTLLNNMGVRCINLEVLACPKYDVLLTKYGYEQECCKYHLGDYFHCSKHEVKVFSEFVQRVLKGR